MEQLRDYQIDAVVKIDEYFRFPKAKVMYQLPTGGGKTEVACAIAKSWPNDLFSPQIYWLTHRKELEKQSSKRLVKSGVEGVLVSSPVRMYNKLRKGVYKPNSRSLLIADEAHHTSAPTWVRILNEWPGYILGLTATPWRLSKKEGFDHLFTFLIKGPSVQELVEDGHLVPCIVRCPNGPLIEGAGNVAGDYSTSQMYSSNDHVLLVKKGIEWLLKERKPHSRTICYTLNVQHAHNVCNYALLRGLKARVILGNTPPDEREWAVEQFSKGHLDLLVCVEVITEGFDVPGIDSILILRPTKSLSLYLQMIGRSMRPAPGKEYALILDATKNWTKHGLPEEDRSSLWNLEARSEEDGKGEAPVRLCPRCYTVNHSASRACRTCGKPFGTQCTQCGTFVFLDESGGLLNICNRCDEEEQDKIFESGVSTIVAGRPWYLEKMSHLPKQDRWGVKLKSLYMVEKGTTVLVTSKKGKRWFTAIDKIVEQDGTSYICKTDGSRRYTKPVTVN